MKYFTFLPILLVGALTAQERPNPGGLVEVNRVAVTVNGEIITAQEVGVTLGPEIARLMAEFPRRGPEFERQLKESRDRIVQELIDRELIMSEFRKREKQGARLPDNVVDREVQRQVRELYGGDMAKLRKELEKSRMGMARYREMTREKMIVQAMRQEKFKDAPPPLPGEVRAEYAEAKDSLRDTSKDKLNYRKIFIPRLDATNPLATPETQLALAEELAKGLREGADFAELAKQHSGDAFADNGGLQEDVARPDLSPEFAAILFDSEVGKTIGPLENPAGFTIARVESLSKGPAPPLSEVRDLIEQRVRVKKTSKRYEEWIAGLREKAMIDIKLK